MIDVESSTGTVSSPGTAGRPGRAPALMKIWSATSSRVPPRESATATRRGPSNRASPRIRSSPSACFRPRSLPLRQSLTIRRLRRRTAAMSTVTVPARTP